MVLFLLLTQWNCFNLMAFHSHIKSTSNSINNIFQFSINGHAIKVLLLLNSIDLTFNPFCWILNQRFWILVFVLNTHVPIKTISFVFFCCCCFLLSKILHDEMHQEVAGNQSVFIRLFDATLWIMKSYFCNLCSWTDFGQPSKLQRLHCARIGIFFFF